MFTDLVLLLEQLLAGYKALANGTVKTVRFKESKSRLRLFFLINIFVTEMLHP